MANGKSAQRGEREEPVWMTLRIDEQILVARDSPRPCPKEAEREGWDIAQSGSWTRPRDSSS